MKATCDYEYLKKALTETIAALQNQIEIFKKQNTFDEQSIVKYLKLAIKSIVTQEAIKMAT